MKISHTSAYAVQALIHMARLGDERLCTVETVAEAHGLPGRYLAKALTPLVRGGLLRSLKGPRGGYRLARPAKEITLLEIVEAVDGPLQGDAPAVGNESGARLNRRLDAALAEAAEQTRTVLGNVALAELVRTRG